MRLNPQQLNGLYISASPGAIPSGSVRGLPLTSPGSRLGVPLSRSGRLIWQGKIFSPEQGTAVNRFAGVRIIRGKVGYGRSVLDGRTSIILDYSTTSRLYRRYRDEIREVAPGIYLGLMYDRADGYSNPVRYFAFQSR